MYLVGRFFFLAISGRRCFQAVSVWSGFPDGRERGRRVIQYFPVPENQGLFPATDMHRGIRFPRMGA